jgi:hypothetical protein
MTRLAIVATLLALSGCGAMPQPSQQPPNGQVACIVRGFTGPVFSWPTAGEPVLQRLGYTVEVHDMGVEPSSLDHCSVVVAHSWGAPPSLKAHGPRSIFLIDPFAIVGMHCPYGARCVNFHNITNVTGAHLDGADNVPASGAGAIPFVLGHVIMAAQPEVWDRIVEDLEPRS